MITTGNQLEFRHYKYFLAVAEELHFRKAAELLYISQPGLSRQIKQMEDVLEIKLFERHNRKVELTKAGLYLQEKLLSHFKSFDDIINEAKLINNGLGGSLKIGYVGSAMQKLIPELLLKFKKSNSNIHINLKEIDNARQVKALLNEEIDIGFVRMERAPLKLKTHSATEETFSLVLPKSHIINSSNFEDISQFRNEDFILFDASYSESYHEKVMQIFEDCNFIPNISHYTVNASSIYRLVENGFGISIVPTSLQFGYNLKIKFIELKNISQRTNLKIVWSKSNSNPVLKAFVSVFQH